MQPSEGTGETIELHITTLGSELAVLDVELSWSGAVIKEKVQALLQEEQLLGELMLGSEPIDDSLSAEDSGLSNGQVLFAVIEAAPVPEIIPFPSKPLGWGSGGFMAVWEQDAIRLGEQQKIRTDQRAELLTPRLGASLRVPVREERAPIPRPPAPGPCFQVYMDEERCLLVIPALGHGNEYKVVRPESCRDTSEPGMDGGVYDRYFTLLEVVKPLEPGQAKIISPGHFDGDSWTAGTRAWSSRQLATGPSELVLGSTRGKKSRGCVSM